MGNGTAATRRTNGINKDFFQTPEICVQALYNKIDIFGNQRILDPCCGQKPIGNALRKNEKQDIDEFDISIDGYDFLSEYKSNDGRCLYDTIIANPPYSKKDKFIKQALNIARDVYMILPMQVCNYNSFHRNFLNIPEYYGRILMTPKFFMSQNYQVGLMERGGISAYAWFHWSREIKPGYAYEKYVDLDEIATEMTK